MNILEICLAFIVRINRWFARLRREDALFRRGWKKTSKGTWSNGYESALTLDDAERKTFG